MRSTPEPTPSIPRRRQCVLHCPAPTTDQRFPRLPSPLDENSAPTVESIVCPHGHRAWDLVRQVDFDLIVIDEDLDELSGLDLLALMRGASMEIPVVFTSRSGDPQVAEAAFQLGAVSFVPYVEVETLEIILARPLGLVIERLDLEAQRIESRALGEPAPATADRCEASHLDLDRGLVALVGNELRGPLSAMLGYAELLELTEGFRDGENRRIVQGLLTAGEQLSNFTEDCVELGQWCAGERAINIGPCQIGEIMRGAVDRARSSARERSVRIDLTELASAQVRGDGEILTDVVTRVLECAIDAGGPNRVVKVRGIGGSSRYRIEIDTSTEVHGAESGARKDESSSRETGSMGPHSGGERLKLALARVALESHDGELSAVRKPEGGLAFQVLLPVRASQVARTPVPLR